MFLSWLIYDYLFFYPRSIFDVNIDSFRGKPWDFGADITDFFNFGLDEVSWKIYCNSLVSFYNVHFLKLRSSIGCTCDFRINFTVLDYGGCFFNLFMLNYDRALCLFSLDLVAINSEC